MSIQNVKQSLTVEKVVTLLEAMGCEQVKTHSNHITSTKGNDSDNTHGVVIYTDGWNALMPTTPEFDSFNVHDVVSVVQVVLDCNLQQALKFICRVCDINYLDDQPPQPTALAWLTCMETTTGEIAEPKQPLPNEVLHQFLPIPHISWLNAHIKEEVLEEFEIGYDVEDNAITIPIRDEVGNLVAVQARTCNSEYTSKYYFIYPWVNQKIVYGICQNYGAIMKAGEVIVFEGAKSVLQAASIGIHNTVAILGKSLTQTQRDIFNYLGVRIILALDTDVTDEELREISAQINSPLHFNDVYVLRDDLGLYLGEKQSPTDNLEMIQNYKQIIYPL